MLLTEKNNLSQGKCCCLLPGVGTVPKNIKLMKMKICCDARGKNCDFMMRVKEKTEYYDVAVKLCMYQFSY